MNCLEWECLLFVTARFVSVYFEKELSWKWMPSPCHHWCWCVFSEKELSRK